MLYTNTADCRPIGMGGSFNSRSVRESELNLFSLWDQIICNRFLFTTKKKRNRVEKKKLYLV